MKSVDTNILVRLLTRDDMAQYRKSYKVFKEDEVFIPDTVILETEWVLRYAYGFQLDEICAGFKKLFGLSNVHIANPPAVYEAIKWHEQGLDFADALHLANSMHCTEMLSLDKSFVKRAADLSPCPVNLP